MLLPVIAVVAPLCNCNYMSTEKEDAPGEAEKVHAWFAQRLPGGWFTGAPEILVDREEITVVGELPAQPQAGGAGPAPGGARLDALVLDRSRRFRGETRDARIALAREAEVLFGRKVSWGVRCEGRKVMFTTLSVPDRK